MTKPPCLRPSRRPKGFTLAELLIVIAIIGVLIAILLPSLSAARRAAASAKCLASLKEIGQAFQMYAQENKRAFPVVEYAPPPAWITAGTPARAPWQYFLVRYMHKRQVDATFTLDQIKDASSLWGCPTYSADLHYDKTLVPTSTGILEYNTPNSFNTGYGMSRYAIAPYAGGVAPPGSPAVSNGTFTPNVGGNQALIRNATINGSFMKMEQWGKRSAEKGLVADSNNYDIIAAFSWFKTDPLGSTGNARRCQPWNTTNPLSGRSYILVDGIRHLSPSTSQKKAFAAKGTNMLFVDGHAAAVDPEEAWIAIRGGGMDIRQ